MRKFEILTYKVDHNREILDAILSRMPTSGDELGPSPLAEQIKVLLPVKTLEELDVLESKVNTDPASSKAFVRYRTWIQLIPANRKRVN
jgi:hypothetical protein